MAEVKAAGRVYVRRVVAAMLLYVVLLLAAVLVIDASPTAWWRFPLQLLPVVPLVYVVWAVVRLLSDVDELQRRIQLEALAFAFGVGSLLTTAYGLLQVVGLPELSWLFVWPVYAVCWVVGGVLAQRRYA